MDLWLVRRPGPDEAATLDLSELSEAERERAASFVRRTDAATYAAAHLALRRVLGGYLGLPASQVPFVREPCPGCGEPHGRPAVAGDPTPLHFSLSHSHGLALVGVAPVPVGVDVELLPGPETVEICAPALHAREQAELAAVPPAARRRVFGRLWTRKEAYLKGIGTGLSRDPSLDYLGADAAARPPGWTVLDVPCGPEHCGAVAVRGEPAAPPAVNWLPSAWLRAGPGLVPISGA